MNKVILMGRFTKNPDVRYTEGQDPMAIARFSLAVDRRGKKEDGQQSADFPSMVAFGKQAQFIEKYMTKGTKVVAEGRIQTGSYTNRDGQKVYTTEVVVESIEFAESKAAADGAGQAQAQSQGDGFMNIPDGVDDLPFN